MSDIYDERQAIKSVKEISHHLRQFYIDEMRLQTSNESPDIKNRRTQLAMNWPGDEIVQQLIYDAVGVMKKFNISPKEVNR